MNSVKSVLLVAVLAAVAYGVYVSITRNPQASTTTADPGWAPVVQMPGPGAANGQMPGGGPIGGGMDYSAPAGGTSAVAPPFVPSGPMAPGPGGPPAPTAIPYPAPDYRGSLGAPIGGNFGVGAVEREPSAARGDSLLRSDNLGGYDPAAARQPVPPAAASPEAALRAKFAAFMEAVQAKLNEGKLAEALLALSSLYDNPEIPPAEARQVTDLLDQLAGTVVYSRQHLLEPPCVVQAGETLEQIAAKYNVPWQLLARINGIRDPQNLAPGRELKVVRGPFIATIDLNRHEMTLMVQGCYAGRFAVGVGRDNPRLEGTYTVRDKTVDPAYYGPDGVNVEADDPRNPLGDLWLGLGDRIGIHGTDDARNVGRDAPRGSICLGQQDIDDVFGILSIGSRVVIRR